MANKVLTQNISEPLNGAKGAKIDINCGTGHLTIDKLNADDQTLAKGTLQYLQNQGLPNRSLNTSDGQATFTLKAGDIKSSGFRFPWAACGGAYEWQIQLNPAVPSDIAVQSRGGNVKLNLTGMHITGLSADTGGGNLDVVLPDNSANLIATAKTGGGNVNLEVGNGTHREQHDHRQQRSGKRSSTPTQRHRSQGLRHYWGGKGDRRPALCQNRQEYLSVGRL